MRELVRPGRGRSLTHTIVVLIRAARVDWNLPVHAEQEDIGGTGRVGAAAVALRALAPAGYQHCDVALAGLNGGKIADLARNLRDLEQWPIRSVAVCGPFIYVEGDALVQLAMMTRTTGSTRLRSLTSGDSTADSSDDTGKERNSSQSIQRAFALLRVVAEAGPDGLNLSEAAKLTKIHVATAHRLLQALVHERAVSFDPYSRLYYVGYDFLRRAEATYDQRVKGHFRPMLERLAAITDDKVFIMVRRDLSALCIDSVQGEFPNRPSTLAVGSRRPLGIGAGSIVLLAALPQRQLLATIDANEERYSRYGQTTPKQIMALVRSYRRDGFVQHFGTVMANTCGIAIPLYDERGQIAAAVSVNADAERLGPERAELVVRAMKTEATTTGPLPYVPANTNGSRPPVSGGEL